MSANFVTQIDQSKTAKLKAGLVDRGFEIAKPPHALFSGKKKGISITCYESLKLVVQGKDKDDFITFYLEPEILGTLEYSYPDQNTDKTPHIGIDEAGKGDFFGPLCVAGLYASEKDIDQLTKMGVKDSKQMNDTVIRKLASRIKPKFHHEIISIFPNKYNELYEKFRNLNRLLAWGHATAIESLHLKTKCKDVLIDQFAAEHVVEKALSSKKLDLNLTQKHKGESDIVVAAASILARDSFLGGMEKLEKHFDMEFPKGASARVKIAGRKFIRTYTRDQLNEVAKLHFKTTQEL